LTRYVALLAALSLVTCACGAAVEPADEPANGLIASADDRGIHLIDSQSSVDRLVPGTKGAWEVAWSPNGELLAFTRFGGQEPHPDLYTIRPDGTERRLLLKNASGPSWSPDGRRLVVTRSTCDEYPDACAQERAPSDLSTVDATSGEVQRLTTNADEKYGSAWSPDGRSIAFIRYGKGISVVHADGSGLRQLWTGDAFHWVAWSPDGSKLAFDFMPQGSQSLLDVAVLDVETGSKTDLTRGPVENLAPSWSPDGKAIAFLASTFCLKTGGCSAHEERELWMMDADGKNARRITKEGYGPPSWGTAAAPDPTLPPSGKVVAMGPIGEDQLLLLPLDGSKVKALPLPVFGNAEFSPDGKRIVHDAGIAIADADGGKSELVPGQPAEVDFVNADPSWSPDGERIVFNNHETLFVIAADGGDLVRLGRGSEPDWSPDGEQIVAVRGFDPNTGTGEIALMDADGTSSRVIAHGHLPSISPDGKKVAYSTYGWSLGSDIYVVPLAGGKPRLVVRKGYRPIWSPDGRYLAFARFTECGHAGCSGRVFVQAVEGGKARPIGPLIFDNPGPVDWID
jgi:Tol biopolymer transport system component